MARDILARNNVTVRGAGPGAPAMVFAHGFGCDQGMWRFVAPAFEDRFRVVLFDYVGCGRSDWGAYDPARYGALDGYASDVLDICAALGLRDAVFVGHSVSAVIGMLAARREPDRFRRLVLVGPSPRYLNDGPDYVGGFEREDIYGLLDLMDRNFLGWASLLAPMAVGNPERPELARELEAAFCAADPAAARRFAEVTFLGDNRSDLAHVPVPSLILQCADDAIAPRSVGDYVHAHLPGSTLRVLDATGHCPHLSHPEETVRLMKAYLAADA